MKKTMFAFVVLMLTLTILLGLASCNKVEFKVDFVVDGEVYATVNTNGKETITIPDTPTKEGYVFDGWYCDKDSWQKPFTANSLLDAPLSSDISVYAKWSTLESVTGTDAIFDGFEATGENAFYMSVSNAIETISLGSKVTINSKSTWTLCSDITGNNMIASKAVALEIGDNVYYALVVAENGRSELYTLTIRRKPIYTVTFDTDGGSAVDEVSVEEGECVSAPDTYKKGYTLISWSYDFASPITENKTISANWAANDYKITYDANGGTVAHEETGVVYDAAYTLEVPTRAGYNFDGWYLGEKLIENGIWNGESDITLVAKWSVINYNITYDLDGGILTVTNPSTYNIEEKIVLNAPQKTGYTFLGWVGTDVTEPTINVEITSGSIGNRSYVAKWSADTYTVTFDTNGSDDSFENMTVTYDKSFTLPTPTRSGYEFVGWFEGDTPYASSTWTTDKNVDLVAAWSKNGYAISYDLDGGTVDGTNSTTYTVEDTFTLINPTKIGYTFIGWTYEGVPEPKLNVTISASTENLNFVAHWQVNTYKLNFDANGGKLDVDSIEVEYSEVVILPEPTKEGFNFLGWFIGDNEFVSDDWTYTEDKTVTAKWGALTYIVSYNLDGGMVDGTNPVKYTTEDTFTLINPTKIGYTFIGWTYGSVTEPALNITISESTGNIDFVAHFEANKNTPYTVLYYQENLNQNGYDLIDTVYGTGTTDTTAIAEQKAFFHFALDATKSKTSGNINGNGNLVLEVYYTRNSYTVTTSVENSKGGSVTSGATKAYGNEITVTATVNAGYTWLDWYSGNDVVSSDLSYTFVVDKDISLVAKWSANEDTFYTVEYYLQNIDNNEYLLEESEILTGTTDTTATASIKSYPHFTYYSAISNVSGNIDGNGEAVLKIYYTRSSYTVTTRAMNSKAGSVTSGSTYRYGKTITVTATTNPGYTFIGWYAGNTLVCETEAYKFTVENNVTLTAKWSANDDTKYTVEYYLENKNKTGYDKVDTVVLEGITDTTANAVISEYAHFTFTNTNSVISGNIAGNGKLVLKVYYSRDVYTINSAVENKKAGTVTSGGKYAYENSVSLVASSNPGYTFIGWYEGDTKVCDTLTFTFNAEKNVTYTAKWSADEDTPYTVNFYKENMTKTGYTEVFFNSITLYGTTDTITTYIADTLEGYFLNSDKCVLSGNINGDGTLTLSVYYKNTYYREGNYIYFGEYPKTLKEGNVTITDTVDSRGYYLGSDGAYYAKVLSYPESNKNTFSNGTTVEYNKTYYFKVEPIRWRILEEADGEALILCDSIIDATGYDSYGGDNNYEDSKIRAWLNQNFYETAFNDMQQEILMITQVDNSAASTGFANNSYSCADTYDKIFLPSYAEITSSAYGFSSTGKSNDTARKMETSDFARANGAYMSRTSDYGCGWYWLRSPHATNSEYARVVTYTGYIKDNYDCFYSDGQFDIYRNSAVNYAGFGVVPAMRIKL